jgi:hypothetical protein
VGAFKYAKALLKQGIRQGVVVTLQLPGGQRTGQSCREWRKRHSTAASGTSWVQCIQRTQRHPRYHLGAVSWLLITEGSERKHTNSSRLDHVANGETLDGLVLGGASAAVGAADGLGVAAALLVAAAAGC